MWYLVVLQFLRPLVALPACASCSSVHSFHHAPGEPHRWQHHLVVVPARPAQRRHLGLRAAVLRKGISDTITCFYTAVQAAFHFLPFELSSFMNNWKVRVLFHISFISSKCQQHTPGVTCQTWLWLLLFLFSSQLRASALQTGCWRRKRSLLLATAVAAVKIDFKGQGLPNQSAFAISCMDPSKPRLRPARTCTLYAPVSSFHLHVEPFPFWC